MPKDTKVEAAQVLPKPAKQLAESSNGNNPEPATKAPAKVMNLGDIDTAEPAKEAPSQVMKLGVINTAEPTMEALSRVVDLDITYKATDLAIIYEAMNLGTSKAASEEPGRHRPLSLPPVGAKPCRAAEGGADPEVDKPPSTCPDLSPANSLLKYTRNEPSKV